MVRSETTLVHSQKKEPLMIRRIPRQETGGEARTAVKKNLAGLQNLSSGVYRILVKLFSLEDVERAEERLRHESDVFIFRLCRLNPK
jgi:hypothetical protein